jgi:glycosyltransferase involved in cell wall biosynthesis
MDMPSEIIVADNGSSDGSKPIALALGCKVIDVSQKGYGAALIGGISAASGKYVVMGDADDSYSMDELEGFIKKLEEGFDLVIGNRFVGGIEQDAMPWLHKWILELLRTKILQNQNWRFPLWIKSI